jgi:hypothetical protein
MLGVDLSVGISATDDDGENFVAQIYGTLERAPDVGDEEYYLVLQPAGSGVWIRHARVTGIAAVDRGVTIEQGPVTIVLTPHDT